MEELSLTYLEQGRVCTCMPCNVIAAVLGRKLWLCFLEQKCKMKYCILLIGLNDLKYIHLEYENGRRRQGDFWGVLSPPWTDFAPKCGLCFQHSTEQRFVMYHAKNEIMVPKSIQISKRLPPPCSCLGFIKNPICQPYYLCLSPQLTDFHCKRFPKVMRGAESGSPWIKAVIKWKCVYCNDLFALFFRHNGYSSPEALFGRADVLSPTDPTGLTQGGGCSASGRCASVSAKGVWWYLQQVWCCHMGVWGVAFSTRKQSVVIWLKQWKGIALASNGSSEKG